MTGRSYPDDDAQRFPRPPATITDADGREIRIRSGDADDVEALVEMYQSFDSEDRAQGIPPLREPRIREWLDRLFEPSSLNVVAMDDARAVGHATLVADGDGAAELAIFVLSAYQGAGIGTELLSRLLGHAQAEGLAKVWLTVERWNEPARALYRTVGFELSSSENFELEMTIRL
jgi:RimJ/RimL family protein N-acetyltransferase